MNVEFTYYSGYEPIFGSGDFCKPTRFVCELTHAGYDYIGYLEDFNKNFKLTDDRLCNNRETKQFGRIYRWVPDENNLVERQMADFRERFAEELKQINDPKAKKPKIKTKKQIQSIYRRKLRQTIVKSIKEVKNDLHRSQ